MNSALIGLSYGIMLGRLKLEDIVTMPTYKIRGSNPSAERADTEEHYANR